MFTTSSTLIVMTLARNASIPNFLVGYAFEKGSASFKSSIDAVVLIIIHNETKGKIIGTLPLQHYSLEYI